MNILIDILDGCFCRYIIILENLFLVLFYAIACSVHGAAGHCRVCS